jgi:FKBP-type peptidyl-prolyl cis-trans isomerase
MKAGGRRVVKVPAALGFGDRGAVLRPTEHVPDKQGVVPPGADLEYDLELVRVSIPPS